MDDNDIVFKIIVVGQTRTMSRDCRRRQKLNAVQVHQGRVLH